MTPDPLHCRDLIAHRRYAYGRAAAEEKDWGAAAELYEQALERAPEWAPAWFALAEAREWLGDIGRAADAFQKTLAADPSDALGAGPRLALLLGGETMGDLPQAYVARLFDDYASRFDAHLTEKLAYRGPLLIAEALTAAAPGRRFASALDFGCGTGLMGASIRRRADRLTGVDLSPGMIVKARERGLYDALEVADGVAFLRARPPLTFDCILAADAFCYFGDLQPVLAACRRALRETGLLAFSAEGFEGEGFRLQGTLRFQHGRRYLERTADGAGFRAREIRSASLRREAGADIPGLVGVLEAG